jgi:hypothetical protein
MITKEKLFFLNQLIDSMEKATEKSEIVNEKKKQEIIDFILSVHNEIKNLLLIVK